MSTYAELQANVTEELRAYGNLTWGSTRIAAMINAGYQEFCRMTHILRATATVTVAADDALYAMPTVTGVSEIIQIWRAVWDDRVLPVATTQEMDRMFDGAWRDDTSTTLSYVMTDAEDPTQIRVYPMIEDSDYLVNGDGDALTLSIDYSYVPSVMTTGSPAIPVRYHPALEAYACMRLLRQPVQSKQDVPMGQVYMQDWMRYLGSAKIETMQGLFNQYGLHMVATVV